MQNQKSADAAGQFEKFPLFPESGVDFMVNQ
jgi:hypothetical protein